MPSKNPAALQATNKIYFKKSFKISCNIIRKIILKIIYKNSYNIKCKSFLKTVCKNKIIQEKREKKSHAYFLPSIKFINIIFLANFFKAHKGKNPLALLVKRINRGPYLTHALGLGQVQNIFNNPPAYALVLVFF